MSKIYVAVSGDNDYDNFDIVSGFLDLILKGLKRVVIVTGTEGKVEESAIQYANSNNLELKIIPSTKDNCKTELYDRQKEILDCSERIVAFWDSVDENTEEILEKARWMNKKRNIFIYS